MADTVNHTDITARRADRVIALLRANADLLNGNGIPVDAAILRIARERTAAARDSLPAYAALPSLDGLTTRLNRVADRLTGTRVEGYGRRATITATSGTGGRFDDGDNLQRIACRITLDILADRDDDPLFDVR